MVPKVGLHHTIVRTNFRETLKGRFMLKWLHAELVCPECLPREISLALDIHEQAGEDILAGDLKCTACGAPYPIQDGVAVLLPARWRSLPADDAGYNSRAMLSAYLWSHYSDFLDEPGATDAYRQWAGLFQRGGRTALDIGCAVGRLAFELTKSHDRVIGLDTSPAFISAARRIRRDRELRFDLVVEGQITVERACALDAAWNFEQVEFIVADALAMPFRTDSAATATSINILEKVPDPRRHLADINRVLSNRNAQLVFSDPFSWDASVIDPQLWLGGRNTGPYPGRGLEVMAGIFSGRDHIFEPPLAIREKGRVHWKIRKTENLWEHITSQYLVGSRE